MSVPSQLPLLREPNVLPELALDRGATFGEVFTRRWVVELILDLVGYTPDRDLASMLLVEPSCGSGAFLGPILDRLVESAVARDRDLRTVDPVRAFDLLDANVELARKVVSERLQDAGLSPADAGEVSTRWVTAADFLLHDHSSAGADFVVGNPPYIRLEHVAPGIMATYRRACPTMRGRSDIYVGFIERGLELLRPTGVLGYICADRWMRNQYGAQLRELISRSYSVDTVVTMHDADAFEDEVSAYPAVVVLRKDRQGGANVVHAKGRFGAAAAAQVSAWARSRRGGSVATTTYEASRLDGWFAGRESWPAGSPKQLAAVADLEARFPPLERSGRGTRVGIGVATGRDDVFITDDAELVEGERLLPLLESRDTVSGSVEWHGSYLVNPWEGGRLVDLDAYPLLGEHLRSHSVELKARHVARTRPAQWYRTIDRVDPDLLRRPKLVLPDLKASAHPVLDEGRYYPHHNLYFVVSDTWDLEVLGGLLLSDIANLFVGAYCVRMRGGCYRFQAQYLRRIRVPEPEAVSKRHRRALIAAFTSRDVEAATAAAVQVYGLAGGPSALR